MELTRLTEIYSHQKTLYNLHPDYTLRRENLPQLQGWAKGQRVLVFEKKPSDYEEIQSQDPLLCGGEYRQYIAKNGKKYYCKPWTNPMDRYDYPYWENSVFEDIDI